MRCPFCNHDYGDARPAHCVICKAGSNGLTEQQVAAIKRDLERARHQSIAYGFVGSILLGTYVVLSILWCLGLLYFSPPFLTTLMGVASFYFFAKERQKVADLRWILTNWGSQVAKPEP